jgi:hypothetical protein
MLPETSALYRSMNLSGVALIVFPNYHKWLIL